MIECYRNKSIKTTRKVCLNMSSLLRTVFVRGQQSINLIRIPSRNIVKSVLRNEKAAIIPPVKDVPVVAPVPPVHNTSHIIGGRKHSPNELEKRFLVWSGKFKSVAEVPASVSQETMEKSRNKARIKIANIMILLTILSCVAVVISGKRAAKRGESVQQMNLDWHRQIKEDATAEKTAAISAKSPPPPPLADNLEFISGSMFDCIIRRRFF